MELEGSPSVDNSQLQEIKRRLEADRRFRSGVTWFFWIAALSVINTILYWTGADISFIFGLGITQFIDAFTINLTTELGSGYGIIIVISIVLDLFFAGIFALFGFLGLKKKRWAIVAGLVLYILDAIFVFVMQVYLDGIFHLLAIGGIITALVAYNKQAKLVRAETSSSPDRPGFQDQYYHPPQ